MAIKLLMYRSGTRFKVLSIVMCMFPAVNEQSAVCIEQSQQNVYSTIKGHE